MVQEEWRDAVGYEDYFLISNTGKVWSKRTNKEIKLTLGKTGYFSFTTRLGGRKSKALTIKVHRLVATSFLPLVEGKDYVNHIDGNKQNNYHKNLEWCTLKENSQHALKHNLLVVFRGEDSCKSILSEKDVIEIKKLLSEKKITHEKIAKIYGVDRRTITSISTRQTCKHV